MAEWYENIPTPMDRGGNVVPLDTKKLFCSGKVRAVKEIGYKLNAWVVRVVGEEDFEFLHDCTLPDGWEQLERDVAKDPCGYFGKECDSGARCSQCPAYDSEERATVMAKDVIRRAKALAGVE